jgi:hypothetical protein
MVGDERREEGRPIETKTVPIGEHQVFPVRCHSAWPEYGQSV